MRHLLYSLSILSLFWDICKM